MNGSAPSGAKVLVVDDEPNITELVAMALRYEGFTVKTAATALVTRRSRAWCCRPPGGPTLRSLPSASRYTPSKIPGLRPTMDP